jgi:hypothetical protein
MVSSSVTKFTILKLIIKKSTVSAQKIVPSLNFWRFLHFCSSARFLGYMLKIYIIFILTLWELAKNIAQ